MSELARIYQGFACDSSLESVALTTAAVFPILTLQRPHSRSKSKDHIRCLETRLEYWKKGDLDALVREGRTLQKQFRAGRRDNSKEEEERLARNFANLMFMGKTQAALNLLATSRGGGVLHLDQPENPADPDSRSVRETLVSKHPPSAPVSPDTLIHGTTEQPHPVIYDSIDGRLIHTMALKTKGAAGPSGLDAYSWRRLCTSFKSASDSLCHSLAQVARRLCSTHIDPKAMDTFLACRLVALDKCPGVRPIGIGDTARRIIAKAVLAVTRSDIQDAAGSVQLCAGQLAGCEAAIHSVRESFQDNSTEAALLVDASNAFNSINRMSALRNFQHLYALPLLLCLSTAIGPPRGCLLMVMSCTHRRGPHKGIPWVCPCMLWLHSH